MSHQWEFAQIEGNLQLLQLLTLNDPGINIELTDEDFGGLQIDKNEDIWVSLKDLRQCSQCGAFMVSDHGGDYIAVLGEIDFYKCKELAAQAHRQQMHGAFVEFMTLIQAKCNATEQQILELLEDCPLLDNDELSVRDAAQEAIALLTDQ